MSIEIPISWFCVLFLNIIYYLSVGRLTNSYLLKCLFLWRKSQNLLRENYFYPNYLLYDFRYFFLFWRPNSYLLWWTYLLWTISDNILCIYVGRLTDSYLLKSLFLWGKSQKRLRPKHIKPALKSKKPKIGLEMS